MIMLLKLRCSGSTTPRVHVSSCEVVCEAWYMLQVFGQKLAEYTTVMCQSLASVLCGSQQCKTLTWSAEVSAVHIIRSAH